MIDLDEVLYISNIVVILSVGQYEESVKLEPHIQYRMSGVYPMVSSSPPPFDEEEGDDWDEDFGNFMGAGHDVSENSVSQDWAAFSDSGSNNTPTKNATSTQENSNITEEKISTKSMELKLDADGSSLITSSDSGLDLNSSHCIESVLQKGLGTVPHVDSGLFSSEVSPSDRSYTWYMCRMLSLAT